MEILELSLLNFRNFFSKKISFDKNLTLLTGPNGSGKSNVLEAISLLCGVRPTHLETNLDLVKFGQSEAKIEGKVAANSPKILTINLQVFNGVGTKKAYLVDSVKKRLIDFGQYLSMVIFHPQDLELVTGTPSLRRHHLDDVLASCDRDYWRSILAYHQIVARRNKVLQRIAQGKSQKAELDFWDEHLCEHGQYISQKREDFFEFLNNFSNARGPVSRFLPRLRQGCPLRRSGYEGRVGGQAASDSAVVPLEAKRSGVGNLSTTVTPRFQENFSWQLKQSLLTAEKLLRNRERDIAAGMTLSGPQRDDFRFFSEGKDLEFFGSRGGQRMAVLALKLAELEYFNLKTGQRPILALDDIFSELDWEHRKAVLTVTGKQQTIVTAAEPDSVPKAIFKKAKAVNLK